MQEDQAIHSALARTFGSEHFPIPRCVLFQSLPEVAPNSGTSTQFNDVMSLLYRSLKKTGNLHKLLDIR